MREFKIEDIETLDKIRRMTSIHSSQVATLNNFVNDFIEGGAHCCPHCPGQIKFFWNRILNWSNVNSEMIEALRKKRDMPAELTVESGSGKCKCGAELKDKRFKYCSLKCKNNG